MIPYAIRVPCVFESLPGTSASLSAGGMQPVLPLMGVLISIAEEFS